MRHTFSGQITSVCSASSFLPSAAPNVARRFFRVSRSCSIWRRARDTLCHENEAKIYGEQPEEVRDLLTSLPRLGGIFDPANYVVRDADPVLGIDVTLPSLVYMHVKGATRDGHLIVPAGEGDGNLGEALDKINASTDLAVYPTVEPHLKLFSAYASIDERELRSKYVFETTTDLFDCAVNSLKNVLRAGGYRENGQYWIK